MTTTENDDGSGILGMYDEVVKYQTKWRSRYPQLSGKAITIEDLARAQDRLVADVGGTIFSLIRDLSHHGGQQFLGLADLEERLDNANIDGGAGTQFTAEDAERFRRVLDYVRETVLLSLQSPNVVAGTPHQMLLLQLQEDTKVCSSILDENVINDDDEDEEGDGESNPEGIEPITPTEPQ